MILLMFIMAMSLFVLGAIFAIGLIGGFPTSQKKEFEPVRIFGKPLPVEYLTIGVTLLTFGFLWLATWIYFLFSRWDSFIQQFDFLITHVVVQLITSLSLFIAGFGVLFQWRRWRGLYLSSIGVLVFSVLLSVTLFGAQGHDVPILMYLFSVWTLAIAGAFTLEFYVFKRMLSGSWDTYSKSTHQSS